MSFPLISASGVIKAGRLVIRDRRRFDELVRGLRDGWEVDIEISRFRATRSLAQNAYYHGVVLKIISDYTGMDSATLHELFKVKFLSREEAVVNQDGNVVDRVILGTSTRGLTTVAFGEYVDQIRQWSADKLGLLIPLPKEDWSYYGGNHG